MIDDRDGEEFRSDACRLIDECATIELAIEALRDALAVDHVSYYSSKLGTKPAVEPYVRVTYTGSWIKRYVQMDYLNIDPVLQEGFSRILPFDWSDLSFEDKARDMLMDALAHGVGPHGFSVPVRGAHGHRGLFSVTSSGSLGGWHEFLAARMRDLVEIGHRIHKRAIREEFGTPELRLTARELDCLFWTGEGKEASDIASILEISRFTVRDYLKSARYKLDCVTSTQAVSKAVKLGLLSLR